MTIDEVAKFLFVSRSHVRRLLQNGNLRGALGDDGNYTVDDRSVRTYREELDERAKGFLDAQTEDNEPPGWLAVTTVLDELGLNKTSWTADARFS